MEITPKMTLLELYIWLAQAIFGRPEACVEAVPCPIHVRSHAAVEPMAPAISSVQRGQTPRAAPRVFTGSLLPCSGQLLNLTEQ